MRPEGAGSSQDSAKDRWSFVESVCLVDGHVLFLSAVFCRWRSLPLPLLAQEPGDRHHRDGAGNGSRRGRQSSGQRTGAIPLPSDSDHHGGPLRAKTASTSRNPCRPATTRVQVEGRNLHIGQADRQGAGRRYRDRGLQARCHQSGADTDRKQACGRTVDTLPINGRNALDLARLDPGVQVVDGAVLDPGRADFSRSRSTAAWDARRTTTSMKSKPWMRPEGRRRRTCRPSPCARLIVTRSMPEVFQALNGAGAVRVTTRSGEDEWHGNLFGNYRDRRDGLAGFPSRDPKYSRQHYGFGAGGALIKDKAFLFVGGERVKQDGRTPVYQGFPVQLPEHARCHVPREHADGASGLQLVGKREVVCAFQLRQRQPDRADRQSGGTCAIRSTFRPRYSDWTGTADASRTAGASDTRSW